ncbi:MAG TPA: hypothetical protein VHU84_02935 [Lacipirellulaceae bacterium]|nr:hypothetical protein [Lacipirellulaceae bacterium]
MHRQPRYSKEEHARRGENVYENQLRVQLEPENIGKIVAIDVDTGEYEIADKVLVASKRLLARLPNAQIWCVRIGHRAVHHFGPRSANV